MSRKPSKRGARRIPEREPLTGSPKLHGVTSEESRSQRAKAILKGWDESRQPFMLYLRKFSVTMYHGPDQRMLLENHFWATLSLHRIGVLTIIDPAEIPLPGAFGHGAPALAVSNDQWQAVVSDLIEKAEMIVSEVPLLSAGAAFELRTCVEKGKVAQTIVIIPSLDGPFPLIDDHPVIKDFPRAIYSDELPELGAVNHFVFRDLVDRMRAIACLEPSERLALVEAGQIGERFPVTFAGLREGYEKAAVDYEATAQQGKAARAYFRALVMAWVQKNYGAAALICEEIARLAVDTGDRRAAVNYLKGGITSAGLAGDELRQQRLTEKLRQLDTDAV